MTASFTFSPSEAAAGAPLQLAMALGALLLVALWLRTHAADHGPNALSVQSTGPVALLVAIGLTVMAGLIQLLVAVPVLTLIILLGTYPCLLAAAISLPRQGRLGSTRALVDGMMILAAASSAAWYFLLGPILSHPGHSTLLTGLSAASVIMDLVLVAAMLITSARTKPDAPGEWTAFLVGLGLFLVGDCINQYQRVSGGHGVSTPADILRGSACIMLAAAVISLWSTPRDTTLGREDAEASPEVEEAPKAWHWLLPYALIPVVGILSLFAWREHLNATVSAGVYGGTLVVLGLAFFRQMMAIRENARLYERVHLAYQESIAHAISVRTLNQELQRTRDELQANYEALAKVHLKLQAQATTDPLTGLPNHRSMVLALDQELERAQRYSRPCSLLFLDLDRFKALNDTLGHLTGDSVLRRIVGPIVDGLRSVDIAGRWGGEEFVVALPETETPDAVRVAERIQEAVAGFPFGSGVSQLTCSIGVATFPYDAANRDELVDAADRAMYAAKRLGGNQVRSAIDPTVISIDRESRRSGSREEVNMWGVVEAFTTMADAHDPTGNGHAQDVSRLAMRVAQELRLGPSEVRTIGLAARLHDLGKVSVPATILNKSDILDDEERAAVLPHPSVGADVVARVPALTMIAPLIRSHHERWDGTGYPDGLERTAIPIGSRIISACDAFSAMTSSRPYAPARTIAAALDELDACAGTQFDPEVVEALHRVIIDDILMETRQVS